MKLLVFKNLGILGSEKSLGSSSRLLVWMRLWVRSPALWKEGKMESSSAVFKLSFAHLQLCQSCSGELPSKQRNPAFICFLNAGFYTGVLLELKKRSSDSHLRLFVFGELFFLPCLLVLMTAAWLCARTACHPDSHRVYEVGCFSANLVEGCVIGKYSGVALSHDRQESPVARTVEESRFQLKFV